MKSFAELVNERGPVRSRALFNALKPLIMEELDRGHTLGQVWLTMRQEKGLQCSYSRFCRLVREARKLQGFTPEVGSVLTADIVSRTEQIPQPSRTTAPSKAVSEPSIKPFVFERRNKEDLV